MHSDRSNDTSFSKVWKRSKNTIITAFFCLLILCNTWLSNALNPIPDKTKLQPIDVVIVASYMTNPHMRVKASQGTIVDLVFPRPFNLTGRGSYFQGITPDAQKKLVGCRAQIDVVPVSFSVLNQYRIWGFKCGAIELSYSDILNRFLTSKQDYDYLMRYAYVFFLLVLALVFYSERKK